MKKEPLHPNKKRNMRFILLVLLLVSIKEVFSVSCADPITNLPIDNKCVGTVDENRVPTPNCINMQSVDEPKWQCARCAVNCDCPVGTYCLKTPGTLAGTCVGLLDANRVDKTCISFGLRGTPGARLPTKDVDDNFVCGEAIFAAHTADFIGYEWLGACISGKCYECASGPLTWALVVANQLAVPFPDSVVCDGYGRYPNLTDTGSLICPQRMCQYGTVVAENGWLIDVAPAGVAISILVFVVFIFFALCGLCMMNFCRNRRHIAKDTARIAEDITDVFPTPGSHTRRYKPNVLSPGTVVYPNFDEEDDDTITRGGRTINKQQ